MSSSFTATSGRKGGGAAAKARSSTCSLRRHVSFAIAAPGRRSRFARVPAAAVLSWRLLCGLPGCAACVRASDGGRMRFCSRCRRVAYCGEEHQRLAWHEGHKAECVAKPAADNAGV